MEMATSYTVEKGMYSHYATKDRVSKGWVSAKDSGKLKKDLQIFSYVVANSIMYGPVRCMCRSRCRNLVDVDIY